MWVWLATKGRLIRFYQIMQIIRRGETFLTSYQLLDSYLKYLDLFCLKIDTKIPSFMLSLWTLGQLQFYTIQCSMNLYLLFITIATQINISLTYWRIYMAYRHVDTFGKIFLFAQVGFYSIKMKRSIRNLK